MDLEMSLSHDLEGASRRSIRIEKTRLYVQKRREIEIVGESSSKVF
jgi:hypothetical protein